MLWRSQSSISGLELGFMQLGVGIQGYGVRGWLWDLLHRQHLDYRDVSPPCSAFSGMGGLNATCTDSELLHEAPEAVRRTSEGVGNCARCPVQALPPWLQVPFGKPPSSVPGSSFHLRYPRYAEAMRRIWPGDQLVGAAHHSVAFLNLRTLMTRSCHPGS